MLKRLEYFSQARADVALETIYGLASRASAKNRRLGVTGWMNYDGVCFFQCIEGEASTIDSLYQSIIADPRHHDIVTLMNEPVDERRFNSWSMHFSADSVPGMAIDAFAGETGAPGAGSGETPEREGGGDITCAITHLRLKDLMILGGDRSAVGSEATDPAIEAAGRRWLAMVFNNFVKHMLSRQFATIDEVAAAIVEMSLLGNRRGPAALPRLKAFLDRRHDLSQDEIVRASRTIHCAVHGRGDALDGLETPQLMTAITAVSSAIRGLADMDRKALRKSWVRRMLVNICQAALQGGPEPAPRTSLKGASAWVTDLIAQSRISAPARGLALGDARFDD